MTGTRVDQTAEAASEERTVALGGGLRAPYPTPRDAVATSVGKGNRRADTKPEVRLRSDLHRRGLRFRKDLLVRAGGVKVHPDIVFTKARVAVFVDGCFWHGCPEHQVVPKSNRDYWVPKLRRNVDRDRAADIALMSEGWTVLRVWEHEDVASAGRLIEQVVRFRRSTKP
ncbi:MAG: very short patch repair endonuclease [Actinobacteria bacterium]|nr:very short patch repair endonuclease [Actinomycetota bacterium]